MRALLLAGVMAVGPAWATSAAEITQIISLPIQMTDLNGAAFINSIALFDMRLGTLTDVQLSLSSTADTSGSVTNTASQAQTFEFRLKVTDYTGAGSLTGNAGTAQNLVLSQYGQFQQNPQVFDFGNQTYNNLASGNSSAYPVSASNASISDTSVVTLTDSSSLAAFTGAGSFGLTAFTNTAQIFIGGGGYIMASLDTRMSETFTATYDYTPTVTAPNSVPEPASIALLGMGAAGLIVARRRRVA